MSGLKSATVVYLLDIQYEKHSDYYFDSKGNAKLQEEQLQLQDPEEVLEKSQELLQEHHLQESLK
jgi:hypothetical protein